mmetsp:Transcript_21173/g.44515  ORF Transcript_21173/g.44515 Transcript_21173/m.44515 type:complete len:602 (+) Transcript_21173:2548-4353(+)
MAVARESLGVFLEEESRSVHQVFVLSVLFLPVSHLDLGLEIVGIQYEGKHRPTIGNDLHDDSVNFSRLSIGPVVVTELRGTLQNILEIGRPRDHAHYKPDRSRVGFEGFLHRIQRKASDARQGEIFPRFVSVFRVHSTVTAVIAVVRFVAAINGILAVPERRGVVVVIVDAVVRCREGAVQEAYVQVFGNNGDVVLDRSDDFLPEDGVAPEIHQRDGAVVGSFVVRSTVLVDGRRHALGVFKAALVSEDRIQVGVDVGESLAGFVGVQVGARVDRHVVRILVLLLLVMVLVLLFVLLLIVVENKNIARCFGGSYRIGRCSYRDLFAGFVFQRSSAAAVCHVRPPRGVDVGVAFPFVPVLQLNQRDVQKHNGTGTVAQVYDALIEVRNGYVGPRSDRAFFAVFLVAASGTAPLVLVVIAAGPSQQSLRGHRRGKRVELVKGVIGVGFCQVRGFSRVGPKFRFEFPVFRVPHKEIGHDREGQRRANQDHVHEFRPRSPHVDGPFPVHHHGGVSRYRAGFVNVGSRGAVLAVVVPAVVVLAAAIVAAVVAPSPGVSAPGVAPAGKSELRRDVDLVVAGTLVAVLLRASLSQAGNLFHLGAPEFL